MDYTQIIRNLLTGELYDSNELVFKLNMNFFYDLEDSLYRNRGLNNYIRTFLISSGQNINNIYAATVKNEENMLFNKMLKNKIDNYLIINPEIVENLEDVVIPIHQIFYRFYIKGGAALKVFVDNLYSLGILDKEIYIPRISNDPTDIDTNLIVNPVFPYAAELIELLKLTVETVSIQIMTKYRKKYSRLDNHFLNKLIKNSSLNQKITELLYKKDPIHYRLPNEGEKRDVLPNGGFSYKPEKNVLRLTCINSHQAKISTYRILLAMDIIDVRYRIEKVGLGEMGTPVERLLVASEAELIDITVYNIDNPKYSQVWEWAKNAMPYGAHYTLYQEIHDMIIDLIQMLQNPTGHPSLIAKEEKRKQRLNYLYFLYCNYRLIQNILENNNKIHRSHVIKYCKNLVEDQFIQLGLTSDEIDTILPYIIGKNAENLEKIVYDFIHDYIYIDQNIQYKLDFNREGYAVSSKLNTDDVYQFVSKETLEHISNYLMRIFIRLDKKQKAQVFSKLVSIYNNSKNDGNTTLILYTAIYKASIRKPESFAGRILELYTNLRRDTMNTVEGLFISKRLATAHRDGNIRDIPEILLAENIGKMCKYLMGKLMKELSMELFILNKYPPYQISCNLLNVKSFWYVYEKIVEILDEYLKTTGVEFYLVYELSSKYPIQIYYRIPYYQTVDRVDFRGKTDIMFSKLFMDNIENRENLITILTYKNKSLYYLNR